MTESNSPPGVTSTENLYPQLFAALGAPHQAAATEPPPVHFRGPTAVLPACYDVSGFAALSVALCTAAVAEWQSTQRRQPPAAVTVDRLHAALAFQSERHLRGVDTPVPPVWDDISGDYPTTDGFIRLHTAYPYHRAKALTVLGTPADRTAVAEAVATWGATALQDAVVAAGGCAAALYTPAEWASHPHGQHILQQPLCQWRPASCATEPPPAVPAAHRPLAHLRVLDLTRTIAGPICTRFLAAYGAQVLRIDPPDFEEVPLLLREVTAGKRRAHLNLKTKAGRNKFDVLLRSADVLVHGYRPGALDALGYPTDALHNLNPNLINVSLSAYGDSGPWNGRRGFDSLVQMSCGIAAAGMAKYNRDRPTPLPAQALDHGTGYLMATACLRALSHRALTGYGANIKLSLARTAALLMSLNEPQPTPPTPLTDPLIAKYCTQSSSAFGRLRHIACPGQLQGTTPHWDLPAGPLGVDEPSWDGSTATPPSSDVG